MWSSVGEPLPSEDYKKERMKRCIYFSQFTLLEQMERGLGAYGFRKRRTTRRRSSGRKGSSKMGLTGRSKFINQLGGWSQNSRRNNKARTFEFTGRLRSTTILVNNSQLQGTSLFSLQPGQDFIQESEIFNSFQKWKVKKVELYANVTTVSNAPSSATERTQFTLAKWRDQAVPSNILNVDGAQSKIIHVAPEGGVTDAELDILRCATFWPPITINGQTRGGSGSLYLMEPWFDGRQSANVEYNTFVGQITRSAPSTQNDPIVYTVLYYFKVTFLAKNAAFQGAVI